MRRRALIASITFLFTPLFGVAGENPKNKMLVNATYVRVVGFTGDEYDMRTNPDDRAAIAAVEQALKKWGRYKLVYMNENADLIFEVRAGRVLAATGGVGVGNGPFPSGDSRVGLPRNVPIGVGQTVGVETGPSDDMLRIYDARGVGGMVVWSKSGPSGLRGRDPALLVELRKDIEKIEKDEQKKQEKKKTP
ncbi:MAG TPA: hypothetical protein VFA60_16140 [Terriglobales bacterium]|nr:hypothetical protein [Terriglobales bacterium]